MFSKLTNEIIFWCNYNLQIICHYVFSIFRISVVLSHSLAILRVVVVYLIISSTNEIIGEIKCYFKIKKRVDLSLDHEKLPGIKLIIIIFVLSRLMISKIILICLLCGFFLAEKAAAQQPELCYPTSTNKVPYPTW